MLYPEGLFQVGARVGRSMRCSDLRPFSNVSGAPSPPWQCCVTVPGDGRAYQNIESVLGTGRWGGMIRSLDWKNLSRWFWYSTSLVCGNQQSRFYIKKSNIILNPMLTLVQWKSLAVWECGKGEGREERVFLLYWLFLKSLALRSSSNK